MSWCEWPEFYAETFPKARKEHRCIECSAPILREEKHLHYRGKWNGKIGSGRQHMVCRKLCMLIRDEFNHGECIAFGELHEYWGETSFNRPRSKLAELDRKARKLMAQILLRERKYLVRRKRGTDGRLYQRTWAERCWQLVKERPIGYLGDINGAGCETAEGK